MDYARTPQNRPFEGTPAAGTGVEIVVETVVAAETGVVGTVAETEAETAVQRVTGTGVVETGAETVVAGTEVSVAFVVTVAVRSSFAP